MYRFKQAGTGEKRSYRKRYKVASDLVQYLDTVMTRCLHPHLIIKDSEGNYWCYTNASSDVYHRLVKRARCEKKSDEDGFCYMTGSEFMNLDFRTAFLDFLEKNASRPLKAEDGAALKTYA